MKKESLVSICIPTFNGEKYISEAIDSIISQTYQNIEVIISDDDSLDSTLKIIDTYKTKLPFSIYNHLPNGIGSNWNNCIRKAKGKYIKFLFQDDKLHPNCIYEMVNVFEKYQDLGLVVSKRKFIIENNSLNKPIADWVIKFDDLQRNLNLPIKEVNILDKRIFKSKEFLKTPLNKIGEPSTVLFKKEIIKEIGYFNEELKQILDYEFFYRILKIKNVALINKNLVTFRIHADQATNLNRGKVASDYEQYYYMLYDEFFWMLNHETKYTLFKRYNRFIQKIIKIKNKIIRFE